MFSMMNNIGTRLAQNSLSNPTARQSPTNSGIGGMVGNIQSMQQPSGFSGMPLGTVKQQAAPANPFSMAFNNAAAQQAGMTKKRRGMPMGFGQQLPQQYQGMNNLANQSINNQGANYGWQSQIGMPRWY